MRHVKAGLGIAMLIALLAPGGASATGSIILNPFGNLLMTVGTGNTATLTINTANGQAFKTSSTTERIYFGLRIMGTEDVEMTDFSLPDNTGGCTVSDFKGTNTSGWQGASAFGLTPHAQTGSANSHMRMIGGFIQKNCGSIVVTVKFRARPVVVYYAAFYGYTAAPWHNNYGTPPWNVVPTGGNSTYNQWWNLWGTFTDLGYSNSCTNVSGTAVTCA